MSERHDVSEIPNPWLNSSGSRVSLRAVGEEEPMGVSVGVDSMGISAIRRVAGVPVDGTFLPVGAKRDIESLVFVGAHGGAGTSTLARMVDAYDGGHEWIPASGKCPNAVVVVARGNLDGIDAALALGRVAGAGLLTGIDVWGLVVVADVPEKPKKTPREILERIDLCTGLFPHIKRVGWIDGLRTRSDTSSSRETLKVLKELQMLNKQRKEQYVHYGQ